MAATPQNKAAGRWLRGARESGKRKRSGPQFAKSLSVALKTTVNTGALYAWEGGTRTVPAAVLLAAAEITHVPIALDQTARKDLVAQLAEEVFEQMRAKGLDV